MRPSKLVTQRGLSQEDALHSSTSEARVPLGLPRRLVFRSRAVLRHVPNMASENKKRKV